MALVQPLILVLVTPAGKELIVRHLIALWRMAAVEMGLAPVLTLALAVPVGREPQTVQFIPATQ